MKDKEQLRHEHALLKERLEELVDFINSEEFFRMDEVEKQLIATQRFGMEIYIDALNLRLWGKNECNQSMSSMLPLLMSTMLIPAISSPFPSANNLKYAIEKDGEEKKGD